MPRIADGSGAEHLPLPPPGRPRIRRGWPSKLKSGRFARRNRLPRGPTINLWSIVISPLGRSISNQPIAVPAGLRSGCTTTRQPFGGGFSPQVATSARRMVAGDGLSNRAMSAPRKTAEREGPFTTELIGAIKDPARLTRAQSTIVSRVIAPPVCPRRGRSFSLSPPLHWPPLFADGSTWRRARALGATGGGPPR